MKKIKLLLCVMLMLMGISMVHAQTKAYTYVKQNDALLTADGISANDASTAIAVSLSFDSDGNGIMTTTGIDGNVAVLDARDMIDGGVLAADFTTTGNGVTRSMGGYNYGTIYSPFKLVVPDNSKFEVYAATYDPNEYTIVLNGNKLSAGTIVPIGQSLVYKSSDKTAQYTFAFSTSAATMSEVVGLYGTAVEKPVDETTDDKAPYVEGVGNISGKEGFFRYTGDKYGAGKAYLFTQRPTKATAKRTYIAYDDETATGINDLQAQNSADNENAVTYNAIGQRVNHNAKGLVIINNKKYFNK